MLDERDRQILALLQDDATMPVQSIADRVALSASACSRRILALQQKGYIAGTSAKLDREKLNLPTTIFVLIRTSRHSEDWLERFQSCTRGIPEIIEVHRLTGNYDYIMKLALPNVEYYDVIYKQLIRRVDMFEMSAYISMEAIKPPSGMPLTHI